MARKWNAVAIPAWSPLEEGQASHKDSPYSWRQYALYPNRNQPSESPGTAGRGEPLGLPSPWLYYHQWCVVTPPTDTLSSTCGGTGDTVSRSKETNG